MKKYFLCLGVLLTVTSGVNAEERVIYCVEEMSVGFGLKDGTYKQSNIVPERFSAKITNQFQLMGSVVFEKLVIDKEVFECTFPNNSTFICRTDDAFFNDSIVINSKSLRFTRTRTSVWGFPEESEEGWDAISVGTCEDF